MSELGVQVAAWKLTRTALCRHTPPRLSRWRRANLEAQRWSLPRQHHGAGIETWLDSARVVQAHRDTEVTTEEKKTNKQTSRVAVVTLTSRLN
jgi:hypothetical protein